MKQLFYFLIFSMTYTMLFSCSIANVKTADRPELNGGSSEVLTERTSNVVTSRQDLEGQLTEKDLEKYAYELGLNPKKNLTETEMQDVRNRRKLRQLERALDSDKERWNYSRIIPLFQNDKEKIEYLSIPTLEGRQSWVNKNKLWNRTKSNKDFQEVVSNQDISIGMTQDLVKKAWGDPESVEFSGNPIYKNERWKYTREMPSLNGYKRERRYVYFEGGRVVGWETD